jgi:hypothetical protein
MIAARVDLSQAGLPAQTRAKLIPWDVGGLKFQPTDDRIVRRGSDELLDLGRRPYWTFKSRGFVGSDLQFDLALGLLALSANLHRVSRVQVVEEWPPDRIGTACFVLLPTQVPERGCDLRVRRCTQQDQSLEKGGLARVIAAGNQVDAAKPHSFERFDAPKVLDGDARIHNPSP